MKFLFLISIFLFPLFAQGRVIFTFNKNYELLENFKESRKSLANWIEILAKKIADYWSLAFPQYVVINYYLVLKKI